MLNNTTQHTSVPHSRQQALGSLNPFLKPYADGVLVLWCASAYFCLVTLSLRVCFFSLLCFHLLRSFVERNSKLFAHTIAHPLAYESSQVELRSGKSEAQSRIPNFIYPHVCTCDFVAHIFVRRVILLVSFMLWLPDCISTTNLW